MSAAPVHETAAFFARARQADTDLAVAHVEAVEHAYRFLCLRLVAHFHKREALRLAAVSILDQRHRGDRAGLNEQATQIILSGRIR